MISEALINTGHAHGLERNIVLTARIVGAL